MEELRDVSSEQLEHFLDDARDLHGKFGNPGRPTLAKLLEPINAVSYTHLTLPTILRV